MARAWRIEYERALYHVLSRGNERQNIVTNDDNRKLLLASAGEMAERFEIDFFAYVLMDNHYHHLFKLTHALSGCDCPSSCGKTVNYARIDRKIQFSRKNQC